MQDKNGWISKTGWISDGWGEGCSQNTPDCIEVIDGLISNTAVGEG